MLVLSRRSGQEIVIGENVRVTVLSVRGDQVRLGVTAPRSVCVDRQEVHQRRFLMDGEINEMRNLCADSDEVCIINEI
jgi:carbon storage regulator